MDRVLCFPIILASLIIKFYLIIHHSLPIGRWVETVVFQTSATLIYQDAPIWQERGFRTSWTHAPCSSLVNCIIVTTSTTVHCPIKHHRVKMWSAVTGCAVGRQVLLRLCRKLDNMEWKRSHIYSWKRWVKESSLSDKNSSGKIDEISTWWRKFCPIC